MQLWKTIKGAVKSAYNAVKDKAMALVGGITAGVASFTASVQDAHAALPAEATAAFTTISGNVTDILAAIWPITAAVVGGFVLLKLFKKGANRAT